MARVTAVLGFLVLTLVTQVGGLILIVTWLIGRSVFPPSLRAWHWIGLMAALFVGLYAAAGVFVVPHWAALAGRVALPCRAEADRPFAAAHPLYCALNRHYVDARLVSLLTNLSRAIDRAYPGTPTLFLDANLPFLDGFPLLPHLSHSRPQAGHRVLLRNAGGLLSAGRAALADRLLGFRATGCERPFAMPQRVMALTAVGHEGAATALSRPTPGA